jgi:hypothetical protein
MNTNCYEIRCEGGWVEVYDADGTRLGSISPEGIASVWPGQMGAWRRYLGEKRAREAQGENMDDVQQSEAMDTQVRRGQEITERIADLLLAAKGQREALSRTITALGDIAVPTGLEELKRQHIAELRALLVAVDRVLAVVP